MFRAFLTHTGALHSVDVRIAGNSTSSELSSTKPPGPSASSTPHIHIQQDTLRRQPLLRRRPRPHLRPGRPRDTRRTAGFSLGTRGGGSGSRGITLGSRPVIDEKK
ncbi:MAG: hypothetical protein R3F43_30190 [bacterium]